MSENRYSERLHQLFKTASLTISDNEGFKFKYVNDKNMKCAPSVTPQFQSTNASDKEPEETELTKP